MPNQNDSQKWEKIVNDLTVTMQSAWIEWQHGGGAEDAMEWIQNALFGPGLIPNKHAPHGQNPQFWFNANKSDPFPECFCGNPSSIQSGRQGFCSPVHMAEAKAKEQEN